MGVTSQVMDIELDESTCSPIFSNTNLLLLYKEPLIYKAVVTQCLPEYEKQQHLIETLQSVVPGYSVMTTCPFVGTDVSGNLNSCSNLIYTYILSLARGVGSPLLRWECLRHGGHT